MEDKQLPRTRRRVYRLRNLKSEAAQVLSELTALSKDDSQSAAKRSVALFTKAELIRVLLTNESEEARAKLKHGADEPEPHEKDEPKAIAASTEVKSDKAETFAEKYQRLTGKTLEEVPNV